MALVVAMAVVLGACGAGGDGERASVVAPAPAVRHGEIDVDGVLRSYRLFVPTTLDRSRPVPLLVALHGGGNSVDSFVETTQFDRAASAQNFIVAYPEATKGAWNAGFCCGSAPERGIDDMAFLNRLLDELEAEQPVDPARVSMTGVSNGAMLAYRFACEQAERITTIASVAGSVTVEECRPSRPLSVLELRGSEDPLIPFDGGPPDLPGEEVLESYPSAIQVAELFAESAGCSPSPVSSTAGVVTTSSWEDCKEGTVVRLVRVEGGGHVWFAPGLGGASGAIDATELITDLIAQPSS